MSSINSSPTGHAQHTSDIAYSLPPFDFDDSHRNLVDHDEPDAAWPLSKRGGDPEIKLLKRDTEETVTHSEGPSNTVSSSLTPPNKSALPLKQCLGFTGCLCLFGGGVGSLAVLIFLTFLWFGNGSGIEGRNATHLWRLIALSNWMTRAITLTTLILRLVVSAQSILCTSMIAALVLEKHFALRSDVAFLSVVRAVNNGPRELIYRMLSSRSSALIFHLEFWLILILAILMAGLHFSSTILVSDLNDFVILGNFNQTQVPSLVSYQTGDAIYLDGTWIERPPVWSVFGEVQSSVDLTPNSDGFSNSGLIQRGFVPLGGSSNRTSVRRYEGNAIVMSSKVACMQPVMDAEYVDQDVSVGIAASELVYGRLQGYLDYGASLSNANAEIDIPSPALGTDGTYFDCYIPSILDVNTTQSSFCLVGTVGGDFWNFDLQPKWNHTDDPWSSNSSIYLVYTTNMNADDWGNVVHNQSILGSPFEEWQTYTPIEDRYLNISVCFADFDLERQYVDISTSDIPEEPTADWSSILVLVQDDYNVTDIQNYISIGSDLTPQERGIFNMTILGPANDGPPSSLAQSLVTPTQPNDVPTTLSLGLMTERLVESNIYYILSNEGSANSTIISCFDCSLYGFDTHPNMAVLFNSIITTTQRPVQAMQSWITSVASTILDTYQSSMGGLQDAYLSTTTSVRTPGPCSQHSCTGFITVITLLVTHLMCVILISILYVRQVRYSRFGNIWHAVSQLISDDLKDTLKHSGDKSDGMVRKELKREGKNDFVKLEKSVYDGKIEMVKRADTDGYASDGSDRGGNDSSRLSKLRTRMTIKSWKSKS